MSEDQFPMVDVTELTPDTAKSTWLGDVTFHSMSGKPVVLRDCILEINPIKEKDHE